MLSSLRTRKYRSLRQISKSPVSNPKLANYPLWCCTMNSMESLAIIRLAQLVSGSFHYYLGSFHCCEDRFHIHVQIYDFHIFTTVYSPLHGFIWNQHSDQLPVGLLAQLVEHCTGITKVMGSNPEHAWIFFRPSFHYYLSNVHYCEDRFHIHGTDNVEGSVVK